MARGCSFEMQLDSISSLWWRFYLKTRNKIFQLLTFSLVTFWKQPICPPFLLRKSNCMVKQVPEYQFPEGPRDTWQKRTAVDSTLRDAPQVYFQVVFHYIQAFRCLCSALSENVKKLQEIFFWIRSSFTNALSNSVNQSCLASLTLSDPFKAMLYWI